MLSIHGSAILNYLLAGVTEGIFLGSRSISKASDERQNISFWEKRILYKLASETLFNRHIKGVLEKGDSRFMEVFLSLTKSRSSNKIISQLFNATQFCKQASTDTVHKGLGKGNKSDDHRGEMKEICQRVWITLNTL